MPAPGDQHKANGDTTRNPFEEVKPQISEYTAQEIATLQSRLSKRLGPEYISTRTGPGNSRVAYLPAEKAINLANEVFGFNGWSSSIQNIQIDFVDENPTKGTISIGLSVVVRITLRDGTYHEDTGYGGIENCKSKIAAFEKAKKEGTTDALKRALRNFGNVLGNCLYDKDYIAKVSKIKSGQGKWDVNELHRHTDFKKEEEEEKKPESSLIPVQRQPPCLVPEDSFDVNEFDVTDFDDLNPDEVTLPAVTNNSLAGGAQSHTTMPNPNMTPSKPPQTRPHTQAVDTRQGLQKQQPHNPAANRSSVLPGPKSLSYDQLDTHGLSRSSSPGMPSQHFVPPQPPPGPQSVGFFSARAADKLDGNNNPVEIDAVAPFNPYAESPSIRKTSGVDHSKSLALNKNTLKPEPLVPSEDMSPKIPLEQARRIGPPALAGVGERPAAPRMSTSAYRPPTRHGPANTGPSSPGVNSGERVLTAAKRAPLNDLSNVKYQPNFSVTDTSNTKRQRIGPGLSGHVEANNLNAAPG